MYEKQILIRFGDMMLKGKNKKTFINKCYELTKDKLKNLNVDLIKEYDHFFVLLNNENEQNVISALKLVSGIQSFSICYITTTEIEDILKTSIKIIEDRLIDYNDFKISSISVNLVLSWLPVNPSASS